MTDAMDATCINSLTSVMDGNDAANDSAEDEENHEVVITACMMVLLTSILIKSRRYGHSMQRWKPTTVAKKTIMINRARKQYVRKLYK
jgi:hypothetical protein